MLKKFFVLFVCVLLWCGTAFAISKAEVMVKANLGDDEAQTLAGDMYYHAQGVKQDYTKAMRWYRKAAKKNNPDAQNNIGVMYFNGHGTAKNYDEAMKWFLKAAERKHPGAMYNVGLMYDKGYGVNQNQEEALKWYRRAADAGSTEAIEILREREPNPKAQQQELLESMFILSLFGRVGQQNNNNQNTGQTEGGMICFDCWGTGQCKVCHGKGEVKNGQVLVDPAFFSPYWADNMEECEHCSGSGICSSCGGAGRLQAGR